jgi:hypothetical protein
MSNSVKLYPNLGTAQGSFSFPFSYLDANDIKAYVDGVLVFENNASTNTAVNGVTYTVAFQSVGATTLTFSPDAIAGSDIRIQRNTDLTTKAVDFEDGAVLTEASLDEAVDQVFFAAQEAIDKANDSITVDTDDKWDAQSKVIKNVATPVNANDAANKDYIDTQTVSAATSAINAATSATNAATSATNAATSASAAAADAVLTAADVVSTNADVVSTNADVVSTNADVVTTGNNVTSAQAAQTAAETAETNAETAETNAETAETNAATSETNAKASEDEAEAWAQKINGEAVTGEGYSSKAWATGGTGVTDTAGSGAAKEWATDTTNTVDGTEYSAKEYAIGSQSGQTSGSAKQWALGGGASYATNTTVDGVNYSAKYWAEQAASSADSVDDTYLGAKSSAPTLDNDGNALQTGALYFNNSSNDLFVWNGTTWQVTAVTAAGFATAGFSIAMSIAL